MINERDTNGVYVYCNSQDQLAALSAACKINPDSVILMETSAESIDGIKWMANIDGCFEALVAGLASGNLQAAQISASIFSKCIATEDSDVLARLKAAGVAGALLQALKDPKVRNCEERSDKLGIRQLRSKSSYAISFSVNANAPIAAT